MDQLEKLRYPIGRFEYGNVYTPEQTKMHLQEISALPSKLFNLVNLMTESQLETPYRPDGWTVRQTVNHIFDSHLNAYTRFHLALTEDNPTVKGYEEQLWAECADGKSAPVEWSLQLLKYLHLRWLVLMNSMTENDWSKTYFHGGYQKSFLLREVAALYAWHSEHHYQHIRQLALREGWEI
jgi:DinB superfamily